MTGLAGEYTGAETGFVYLRARYYDPATGQFLSRDPLVALAGSAYGYVDGNPLNFTDPLGLLSWKSLGQSVKKVAGVVAVASSAVAAIAYTTAVLCGPLVLCSGTAVAVVATFSGVSALSERVATAIECTVGGGLDKACLAGVASTAINALVPRVGGRLTKVLGEELGAPATAASANFGFSTNTASLLWSRRSPGITSREMCP